MNNEEKTERVSFFDTIRSIHACDENGDGEGMERAMGQLHQHMNNANIGLAALALGEYLSDLLNDIYGGGPQGAYGDSAETEAMQIGLMLGYTEDEMGSALVSGKLPGMEPDDLDNEED